MQVRDAAGGWGSTKHAAAVGFIVLQMCVNEARSWWQLVQALMNAAVVVGFRVAAA